MSNQHNEEEEKYFQQMELVRRQAMRKEMEKAAAVLAEARRVGEIVGSDDAAVAASLRKLGFDHDTARIFDLLPLVHVAWADGSVSRAERQTIFRVLERRGIEASSQAFLMIASLLEEKPTAAFLDETLSLLRTVAASQGQKGADVVEMCLQVARASGGFLGLVGNPVSDEERALIAQIASTLGDNAQRAFEAKLGE